MTPADAAMELLRRRAARQDFGTWCELVLALLGQKPAAHHQLIIRELQAVADGETSRLMLFLPPGSAKSTYASVLFPAWWLAQGDNRSMIGASHTAMLAEGFSRRVRGLVQEHSALLGIGVANEAVELWSTTRGGQYRAAGVGGAITGFRADCVVGSTTILTDQGIKRIDELDVSTETRYILSYENESGACTYRRVVATARRDTQSTWRIHTSSGNVVEATGNHRFWTERGWCAASALVVGDSLLRSVQETAGTKNVRGGEVSASGHVLQQEVFNLRDEQGHGSRHAGMPSVWDSSSVQKSFGEQHTTVLRGLPWHYGTRSHDTEKEVGVGTAASYPTGSVQVLQCSIPTEVNLSSSEALLKGLCESNPCQSDVGKNQSWISAWVSPSAKRCARGGSIQAHEAIDIGTRPKKVRGVSINASSACPSYQYESDGQPVGEPSDALPWLSHTMARWGAFKAEADVVALVEQIHKPATVYDIQVEGTECFFANGVLVHNCVIADDLVKSRADADSETYRDRAWEWWMNDLTTRLKPGAPCIVIGTRWHMDDIYGRLLERQAGLWRVLSLPAIAEGYNDPLGRQPGEALWADDAYGYAADLALKRATSDARTWSALFQQNPVPDSGSYFLESWLRPVATVPPLSSLRVFGASDYAVTADGGDWTAHVVVGVDSDDRLYLLDVWRVQASSDVWVEAFCDLVIRWHPMGWAEETGQIRAGIGPWLDRRQRERRAYVARTAFPTRGDKAVRAQSIRGRLALSGLHIQADAPWRADFEAELLSFPAGKHDDQVDALGLIGQILDVMLPPEKTKAAVTPQTRDYWAEAVTGADDWQTA